MPFGILNRYSVSDAPSSLFYGSWTPNCKCPKWNRINYHYSSISIQVKKHWLDTMNQNRIILINSRYLSMNFLNCIINYQLKQTSTNIFQFLPVDVLSHDRPEPTGSLYPTVFWYHEEFQTVPSKSKSEITAEILSKGPICKKCE